MSTLTLIFTIHASATTGFSNLDPVGGTITSSVKPLSINQRLDQKRL
jgi:hypothetical protein